MGRVAGKTVLITGGARGQGRSHAVRLADEGADIALVDLCADIDSVPYSLATVDDLAQTVAAVEAAGGKALSLRADVRDRAEVRAAVDAVLDRFGRLDVVIANAGIAPLGAAGGIDAFVDAIDVNLLGAITTINTCVPHLRAGASVIAIGSFAAQRPRSGSDRGGVGSVGYKFSKQTIAAYVHELATVLAPRQIRVNAVHPTNTDTAMLHNSAMYGLFVPGEENPTREQAERAFPHMHAMPVGMVEPEDISNAVLFLASDESRYITGMQLRIDAGGYLKVHDYRV